MRRRRVRRINVLKFASWPGIVYCRGMSRTRRNQPRTSHVGARLTELRQSSAAGKHGKTRKSQRASGNARAIRESQS